MRNALALCVLLVLLTGCAAPVPAVAPKPAIPLPVGAATTIRGDRAFVVVDRAVYARLIEASQNRDPRPVEAAYNRGDLLTVAAGTRVTVLRTDGDLRQVEMLDGQHAGRAGWLSIGWLDQ